MLGGVRAEWVADRVGGSPQDTENVAPLDQRTECRQRRGVSAEKKHVRSCGSWVPASRAALDHARRTSWANRSGDAVPPRHIHSAARSPPVCKRTIGSGPISESK